MLTPIELRTIIEESIGNHIGYYKLPDKNTHLIRAIAVLPDNMHGDNYPPVETQVLTGLEVVIHKPILSINDRLSGDGIKVYKWEIFINQWNKSKLVEATNSLIDALHDKRLSCTPATYSSINPGSKTHPGTINYSRIAIIEKEFKQAKIPLS